jgi:hypothetical protein
MYDWTWAFIGDLGGSGGARVNSGGIALRDGVGAIVAVVAITGAVTGGFEVASGVFETIS